MLSSEAITNYLFTYLIFAMSTCTALF